MSKLMFKKQIKDLFIENQFNILMCLCDVA